MFPLFFRSVSGVFAAFFRNDSGNKAGKTPKTDLIPKSFWKKAGKKRKHFPEKERNLLSLKVSPKQLPRALYNEHWHYFAKFSANDR